MLFFFLNWKIKFTLPIAIWQMFSKFFIFFNLFYEPWGEWKQQETTEKFEKQEAYFSYCTKLLCDNYLDASTKKI